MTSMDQVLAKYVKELGPRGGTVRLKLVKGPMIQSVDPLNKASLPTEFPRMGKFTESVAPPSFTGTLRDGRLYEEDVPRIQDESDDEDGEAIKKKKRWRRHEIAKRHWVLQEKQEFLEKMIAKRRRKLDPAHQQDSPEPPPNALSSRYEGVPEANPSTYVLFQISSSQEATVEVTPVHGFQTFSQPAKFSTLSLHEAEQAIEDQRSHMTRYMMHGKSNQQAKGAAKSRLLGKLSGGGKKEDEEDDDIMGDLAFRNRKGGNKARKELLTSLGDGVTVDADGVMGGANDAEFGGRRQFGRLAMPTKSGKDSSKSDEGKIKSEGNTGAASNGGMAMGDDFYQRDVAQEYEDMDYDANEQFDDDDVDLGEGEVMDDGGGFADELDEDEEDEYDDDGAGMGGAEGLATVAGFKAMLAKARGEVVDDGSAGATASNTGNVPVDKKGHRLTGYNRPEEASSTMKSKEDNTPAPNSSFDGASETSDGASDALGLDKVMEAAKVAARAAQNNKAPSAIATASAAADAPVELDENGKRVLSLMAIQGEIWLRRGAIRMKHLMKIFDMNRKSSTDRQNKFRELVRELCTMKKDPVDGNMLVLKQHWAKAKINWSQANQH